MQREEFSRRMDAIYRAGFAGCWPFLVLAVVLLVAGVAVETGVGSSFGASADTITAAFFVSVLAGTGVFTWMGERTARRLGPRCQACGTPLYGGPRRNAILLNTGRCLRCGAQVLADDVPP